MATDLPIPVGASPRGQIYHDVYDARARLGHWLADWQRKTVLRNQLAAEQVFQETMKAQAADPHVIALSEARAAVLQQRAQEPPEYQPVPDPEAAALLTAANSSAAVPAEVADAYRALIEARALAEPGADPTDADAARVRERYGVVHAWLETQG